MQRESNELSTQQETASIAYTIAVCTRNRADLLGRTLRALTEQTANFTDTEIIVVDNNSDDTTATMVARFANVRYIIEKNVGISWGRNRAVQEARGKWIIYVDDDAVPVPAWFQVMRQTIEHVPAPLHSVLGKVDLEWEHGRAEWFPPAYETLLSRYDLGNEGHFLQLGGYLLTTNAAFDREYLLQLGGFCIELGHRDKSLLGGEDNDIYDRLLKKQSRLWYEPCALVKHWVPLERQTFRWLVCRVFWDGAGQPLLDYGRGRSRRWYLGKMGTDIRRMLRLIVDGASALGSRSGQRDLLLKIVQKCGRFWMNWRLFWEAR